FCHYRVPTVLCSLSLHDALPISQDLWMRWIIGGFAGVSAVGLGFAWRNLVKSSELQMRLLRASELNTHLKEMNLAAAGLAHETRDRKSTRLNSSHQIISYAVFCF